MNERIRSTKRVRIAALLGLLVVLAAPGAARADIVINLGRGPITVHVPSSYDPATPTPLVMLLHGYGASGAIQESYMQFLPLSEEFGFLYLYPDGTVDSAGNRFWNATDACCNFFGSSVDDSGYLQALIDEIKSQLNVDDARVHLIGHSNGGFMSYRIACDHSDVIASIASLAGATFFDSGDCTPSVPVHVLQIHGTSDTVILYDGGTISGVPYPGAVETVETWAAYDGCDPIADDDFPPLDLDGSIPGDESLVSRYASACQPGGSGELWTIVGGSHVPTLSSEFSRLVIEYLYSHPKPLGCLDGTVNDAVDPITDVAYINGTTGGPERTVEVPEGELIWAAVLLPPAGGNGKFVMHADLGEPIADFVLPAGIGPTCFPFLLPQAMPGAVWNNLGKENRVGASRYFDGSPIEDPDRAPAVYLQLSNGDPTNLPLGTTVTFQAVVVDPGSGSPKGASTTNAVILRIL